MKDQGYRLLPLGAEAAEYLRFKSRRLTRATHREYESCLDKLARHFPTLELSAFEPPAGIALVEDFLTDRWGARSPRTYNKNLTIVHDFFEWQVRRGALRGDPTLPIERATPRAVHRTTFAGDQRAAIIDANPDLRDRLALRLLLDYGIRKGALQTIQLEHFDAAARRLVIFTKGERVHQIPIPDEGFWADLAAVTAEPGSARSHFLLPRQRFSRRRIPAALTDALEQRLAEAIAAAVRVESHQAGLVVAKLQEAEHLLGEASRNVDTIRRFPDVMIGEHGLHDWWYRCLERAGVVVGGATRGERMHKARHTAGQRVLDVTGNLKAAQKLLGHASIKTTADNYTDWDLDQLADTMREVIGA